MSMIISVTKAFKFDAAHSLPNYDGVCKKLHGHSYKLEVTISSEGLCNMGPKVGMLLDFIDLKEIVAPVIGKLDHSCLNDFFENPTAELIAISLFGQLKSEIESTGLPIWLERVKLWETEDSFVEIRK